MRNIVCLLIIFVYITKGFSQESSPENKKQNHFSLFPTKTLIEMAKEQQGNIEITEKGDTIIATKTWKVVRKNNKEKDNVKEINDITKNTNNSFYKQKNFLTQTPTKDLIKIAQEQNGTVEITENGDTIITTKNWKVVRKK